jgi:prepilin-type N-terminal cleavage/methylation domain-containing protein
MLSKKGFTFIEIMISLVVIGVLFIPMIQLFSSAIYSVTVSGEGITAVNLARWEMERLRNFNATKSGLKKIGDLWTPNLDEPPLEINQAKWRTLRHVYPDTDPLEVRVEVYRSDNLKKPVVSVATLVEDSIWI